MNVELIESFDDHFAVVMYVKLTCNEVAVLIDIGCNTSRCHHQLASNDTVYDMAIDPATEVPVTVGQDKKINTFSISSGKLVKTFKQDIDFGEPIKVSMDPSNSYLVCSYSNKSMCIYDFGVIFLPDCKHIVYGDWQGCIADNKDPSFKVKRTLISFRRKEAEVFLVDEKFGDSILFLRSEVLPPREHAPFTKIIPS